MHRRILPNLNAMPPVRGAGIRRLVFVTGVPSHGANPRRLLEALAAEVQVFPVLFAYDSDRVLFATLAPAPDRIVARRPPVTDLLRNYLRSIEVVREDLELINPLVNHRYESLFETLE
jgi:hypothetical protein